MSEQKTEEKDLSLNDFAKALQALSEVNSDKYKDILDLIQNTDNGIKIKTDLNNDQEKKKLYQYLTYLFVGGLAGEVNVATGNMSPYPKGLNLRLKDMSVNSFNKLLKQGSWGNIINETAARRKYNNQENEEDIDSDVYKTPSNVLNNAYRKVMNIWISGQELNKQLEEFVKLYNDSKEDIKKVDHNNGNWCRCGAKRPLVALWRMFKKAYRTQDFSYASRKYQNVFSLLDATKKNQEINK